MNKSSFSSIVESVQNQNVYHTFSLSFSLKQQNCNTILIFSSNTSGTFYSIKIILNFSLGITCYVQLYAFC